jgi:hypothetical protein
MMETAARRSRRTTDGGRNEKERDAEGGGESPGQRFSDARPLTLLAALSTGNHVILVRRR